MTHLDDAITALRKAIAEESATSPAWCVSNLSSALNIIDRVREAKEREPAPCAETATSPASAGALDY